MKTLLILGLITTATLAQAQVSKSKNCQVLDKYDIEYLEGILKTPTRGEKCNDRKYPMKFLIQHESGDLVPFEVKNINYGDLKDKVSVSKSNGVSLLKIDGKVVSASKVVIIEPACREGWGDEVKMHAYSRSLGECNESSLKIASGWTTEDEIISKMEMINSPLYKQASKKCIDKITTSPIEQVKNYLTKNKASIVSIRPAKGVLQNSGDSGIEFINFEIQAKSSSNKVSDLVLSVPLKNNSTLTYLKRTDALGEAIKAEDRPTNILLDFGIMKGDWLRNQDAKEHYSNTTALLYNSGTNTDLLKIDISGAECKEKVQFNIEEEVAEASIDNSARGNSKSDLDNSGSGKSSSSSSSSSKQ
jgi:hypothetical protein